ncbi:hypothetical protein GQ44DRAFT_760693 [Phaeosphaeriaceae sp. PMI808]|nr:hypothetical protein GQ44DRAFT_760693 [Phaeosphaeriaceae sp. PMI808]
MVPPPPKEVATLTRVCILGDLDDDSVRKFFENELQAYTQHGHPLNLLWPVLLAAVEYARSRIIKHLLAQMHIQQAIKSRSKEVFEAFLDNGWDAHNLVDTFYHSALARVIN